MINQYTPYGNLEYTQRGTAEDGTPQYSATQTLSPDQQAILGYQNQAAKKYGETANTQLNAVSNKLSQPLDYSSLGAAPTYNDTYRTSVENAMFDRLNPQFTKDRDALVTQLANQGITDPGSQAYITAIDEINRKQNDARLGILATGQTLAGQQYSNELTSRNQQINELNQQRSVPLNELAAMLTGTQVQSPSYINAPQQSINPADIMGATYANYNGAQNAYAQQVSAQNAATQGLYGMLGAGLGGWARSGFAFSDRRLKKDIKRIGVHKNGLPVYSFTYLWGERSVGFMADEVLEKYPYAVANFGGFDAVNYGAL